MPEVIDPNESESRQSLYRDLLSHLNTTLWGSPSTLPRSESGQYTLDFNPVEAFDKSKNPEGAIYAEPQLNWIESAMGNKGPGWQSRTLDWLAGRLGKAPKQATIESWISKAKGAGLPTEERDLLTKTLSEMPGYSSKDRIGADAVGFMAEKAGLPTQGIYTKELSEETTKKYNKAAETLAIRANRALTNIEFYRTQHNIPNHLTTSQISRSDKEFAKLNSIADTRISAYERARKASGLSSPRWSQFNLEEVTSPREILYKAKGSTYKNPDIDQHYGDLGEGLQWHQREGKLKFPEGESTHLTEQQSDLASEWAKDQSYLKSVREFRQANPDSGMKPESSYAPKPTLHENWYKTGFRDLVNRAVKEDSKFVSWDSAAVQKKRWPAGEGTDKFFDQHYDQRLVNFVKKEYGVTPEKVAVGKGKGTNRKVFETEYSSQLSEPVPYSDVLVRADPQTGRFRIFGPSHTGNPMVIDPTEFDKYEEAFEYINKNLRTDELKEVWRIPITDEIKRKVILEGQYFSKKPEEDFRRPYDIG